MSSLLTNTSCTTKTNNQLNSSTEIWKERLGQVHYSKLAFNILDVSHLQITQAYVLVRRHNYSWSKFFSKKILDSHMGIWHLRTNDSILFTFRQRGMVMTRSFFFLIKRCFYKEFLHIQKTKYQKRSRDTERNVAFTLGNDGALLSDSNYTSSLILNFGD